MTVATSGTATVTLPAAKQILIEREFAASAAMVWRAVTEPALVPRPSGAWGRRGGGGAVVIDGGGGDNNEEAGEQELWAESPAEEKGEKASGRVNRDASDQAAKEEEKEYA